jgi:hypothetical protein
MSFETEQRFRALERLIATASVKSLDEQTASYLCRLGSVQICGNLERCVELLIVARVGKRSVPQVSEFLKAYFKRGSNYDCEQLCQLLFRFDSEWGRKLEAFVASRSDVKEGIASCYAVRNSVAHGGGQSLGPKVLEQYFEASRALVTALEVSLD